MRSSPIPTTRSAFTLLEMMLAVAIAVMLLSALYVAIDLQLRHMEAAREVAEQTTLARTLFRNIANDISPSVGMADPSRFQQQSSQAGSGSGSGSGAQSSGTGAAASPTGATTPTTGSSSGASSSSSSASSASSFTTSGPTLLVLIGDSTSLTVYMSRQPGTGNANNPTAPAGVSDQRRISYWLAGSSNSPIGLAREELEQTTSDDAANGTMPPDVTDPNSKQIYATEVKSLEFQYFDGSDWQDSWDGTQTGSDGVTPIGPPAAVAITIGLALPGAAEGELKKFRHVVAIPTANNPTPSQTSDSSSTGSGNTTTSP